MFVVMRFCVMMRRLCIIVQLVLVFHLNRSHAAAVNDSIATITSFMIQNHVVSSVVFTCWKKADTLHLSAGCSAKGLRTQIHKPDSSADTTLLLQTSFCPLAVIVDLQCEWSSQLLRKLAEGTWDNFMDFQYRHINTDSKVQYVLMSHIAAMLNFRLLMMQYSCS